MKYNSFPGIPKPSKDHFKQTMEMMFHYLGEERDRFTVNEEFSFKFDEVDNRVRQLLSGNLVLTLKWNDISFYYNEKSMQPKP